MLRMMLSLGGACILFSISYCTFAIKSAPNTPEAEIVANHFPSIHWISVDEIEKSLLGRPPISVVFDIDDTVLFSNPGFDRGQKLFSPGKQTYLNDPAFWEKMNNDWNKFSMPKEVARALIDMHLRRDDRIYFVTERDKTNMETLTQFLQEQLFIPQHKMNSVVFTGFKGGADAKIPLLKQNKVRIFYGDADSDIIAARAVGARAIRILRSSDNSYQPLPRVGAFGEEVIVNSEY